MGTHLKESIIHDVQGAISSAHLDSHILKFIPGFLLVSVYGKGWQSTFLIGRLPDTATIKCHTDCGVHGIILERMNGKEHAAQWSHGYLLLRIPSSRQRGGGVESSVGAHTDRSSAWAHARRDSCRWAAGPLRHQLPYADRQIERCERSVVRLLRRSAQTSMHMCCSSFGAGCAISAA